jgi:hypothetical protein
MLARDVVEQAPARDDRGSAPLVGLLGAALVAAGWTALRMAMTRQFPPASWQILVELRAPLPFGHRVLVPLLSRPFVDAGVPVATTFAVSEFCATLVLLVALHAVLVRFVPARAATLGALGFLGVLAFPLLLAHRWAIFYPWDAWALVATALGFFAIVSQRFGLATAIVLVGATNRETVVLLPLVAVLLHLDDETHRTRALAWAGLMIVAYVAGRAVVAAIVPHARGAPLDTWVEGELRVLHNLQWLAAPERVLQWLGSIAFAPLLWLAARPRLPPGFVRLEWLAIAATAGLVAVANVYEPRVYGELLVLLWVGAWIGIWRWAEGGPPTPRASGTWGRLDRFGWAAALLASVLALALFVRVSSGSS